MQSEFIKPRLIDYFDLDFTQSDVDFAIPYLTEDIPLFIDPFLLWTSKNALLNQLHDNLMDFFELIRLLVSEGDEGSARRLLFGFMEPNELGLGYSSGKKRGSTIGEKLIGDIITMYREIPEIKSNGLNHIEEIQFVVPNISADRISDITYCILKEFFVRYTTVRADEYKIPTKDFMIPNVWDADRKIWNPGIKASLPYSPIDESPLILAPLGLLRHLQWINSKDYKTSFFYRHVLPREKLREKKIKDIRSTQIIQFNRQKYARVQAYVHQRERAADQCDPDPFNEETILEEKLRQHNRALNQMEVRAARYGESAIPSDLALDIEDHREKVRKLETEYLAAKRYREKKLQELEEEKKEALANGWEDIISRGL